jgi:hypothetical protein
VPIVGAHILLYTTEPERLRAVLRDVLGWRYVEDPGSEPGWLIFAYLRPSSAFTPRVDRASTS